MNKEQQRLDEARNPATPWKKWGPYLSERQWDTVREDYSENGNAWDYFSHDQSRSRAYHWGEDGLAGISDEKQRLCFALALWNGKDPILKERLFGLINSEGNHGEDVKEYYFYLDSTPTHSYMKYLYKYPQAAFPYDHLVKTNRERSRREFEYELINTGIFDQDRYFDVVVEYAKGSPEDILIQILLRRARTDRCRQFAKDRDQGGSALSVDHRAREKRGGPASVDFDSSRGVEQIHGQRTPARLANRSTRFCKRAARRRMNSTPTSFQNHSTPMRPTSCARRWSGCSGPSSSFIST